jgi:hypothetical protein
MSNQTKTPVNFNDNQWRDLHSSRSYVQKDGHYEHYQLAYQTGHEGYDRYSGKSFDEAETELQRNYEAISAQKGGTILNWDKVKDAARDAWDRAGTT